MEADPCPSLHYVELHRVLGLHSDLLFFFFFNLNGAFANNIVEQSPAYDSCMQDELEVGQLKVVSRARK